MHVLITGGAGFIGSRVAKALLDGGCRVTLLDLVPDQPADWWSHRDVRVVEGDIRDRETVARVMAEVDACWHLAAAHHDTGILPETYFSVNEEGTRILCEEMSSQGVDEMCFFSSVAVYGPRENRESLAPANAYGESKLAGENVIREWAKKGHRKVLIIRPVVVFGPENFANMYTLIRQIDRGVYWPVGPGENHKSMAYVENLVTAALARWNRAEKGTVETANYADKPDLRSREIAATLFHALGKRSRGPPIPVGPARVLLKGLDKAFALVRGGGGIWLKVEKFAVNETLYSSDFETELGAGGLSLQDGLRIMVLWYKAHGKNFVPRRAIPPAEVRRGASEWRPE